MRSYKKNRKETVKEESYEEDSYEGSHFKKFSKKLQNREMRKLRASKRSLAAM